MNANFSALSSQALNRTGGTLTGNILASSGVTIDGVDIGATVCTGCSPTFTGLTLTGAFSGATGTFSSTLGVTGLVSFSSTAANALDVAGGITAGSGNVAIIDTSGKIPALSSTYFASLSGANLTGVPWAGVSKTGSSLADLTTRAVANLSDGANVALLNTANTFTSTIAATGVSAPTGTFTTGTFSTVTVGAGILTHNATYGTHLYAATGSTYDFALINAAQTAFVMSVAPGTLNTTFGGSVAITTGLTVGTTLTATALTSGAADLTLSTTGTGDIKAYVRGNSGANDNLMISSGQFFDTSGARSSTLISVGSWAGGTGTVTGNVLYIGRNTSGNGAPGILVMERASTPASGYALWFDNSGNLRTGSPPQEFGTPAHDSGTVIGTQSSARATKNIYGTFTDYTGALQAILDAPLFEFDYKSGAFHGQRFVGVTTDDSPIFGMDQGRSFNPVTGFGYTVAAIKALEARLRTLEQETRK